MIFPLRLPLRLTLTAQALASPRQSNPHVDPNGRLKLPSCFGRPDPLVLTLKITSLESSSCHEVDGFPRQQRQQRLGAPLFCGWRRRLSSKHDSGGGANGMFYRPLPAATITRGSAVNKAQAQASPDERDKDVVAAGKGVFGRGVGDNALRSEAVRAYVARKREMLDGHATRRRDLCEKCQRARKMCLCSCLPAEAISTATRFVILQHPAEAKRRITGTVPLVLHCLSNCRRVVMHSTPGMEPDMDNLREMLGLGKGHGETTIGDGIPLLLFPCPGAEFLEDIAARRQEAAVTVSAAAAAVAAATRNGIVPSGAREEGERVSSPLPVRPSQPPSPPPPPPHVVVLVDGTWSQAKQILSRYPFLSSRKSSVAGPVGQRLIAGDPGVSMSGLEGDVEGKGNEGPIEGAMCRAVKFRSAGSSSYGFRREPSPECISTLESVAYTLEVLEGTPDALSAAAYLREAFSAMVAVQVDARDANGTPRFVDRKTKTVNRRSTRKKNVAPARR